MGRDVIVFTNEFMTQNEALSKELEECLKHFTIFSEETKIEVRAEPFECKTCSCNEEFLEIKIETEEDDENYSMKNHFLSRMIAFYVRDCCYVPFLYLMLLLITKSTFGELFSFIFSLVTILSFIFIHYHYHYPSVICRYLKYYTNK